MYLAITALYVEMNPHTIVFTHPLKAYAILFHKSVMEF